MEENRSIKADLEAFLGHFLCNVSHLAWLDPIAESVQVNGGGEMAAAVTDRTKIFAKATSLGGVESLIKYYSITKAWNRTPESMLIFQSMFLEGQFSVIQFITLYPALLKLGVMCQLNPFNKVWRNETNIQGRSKHRNESPDSRI